VQVHLKLVSSSTGDFVLLLLIGFCSSSGIGDGDCPSIIIEIVASRMGGEGCCPLEWCGI
jgi:hypothetical protein